MRGIRSEADLLEVGRLIRRTWAVHPDWNAWTFARWDVWCGWRIAEARLRGRRDWEQDVAIWEDGGEIVAAAFIGESATDGVLLSSPAHARLLAAQLDWLEERRTGALRIEVRPASSEITAALGARGFERDSSGLSVLRAKPLDRKNPAPILPRGIRIERLENAALDRYTDAVRAVFGRTGGAPDEYAVVRRGPSGFADAQLVAVDGKDRVVAFAEAWLDRNNLVAEFEPVGTVPARRGEDIAAALMLAAENRLRRADCLLATVHSWAESPGANRLYESVGYAPLHPQEVWV